MHHYKRALKNTSPEPMSKSFVEQRMKDLTPLQRNIVNLGMDAVSPAEILDIFRKEIDPAIAAMDHLSNTHYVNTAMGFGHRIEETCIPLFMVALARKDVLGAMCGIKGLEVGQAEAMLVEDLNADNTIPFSLNMPSVTYTLAQKVQAMYANTQEWEQVLTAHAEDVFRTIPEDPVFPVQLTLDLPVTDPCGEEGPVDWNSFIFQG